MAEAQTDIAPQINEITLGVTPHTYVNSYMRGTQSMCWIEVSIGFGIDIIPLVPRNSTLERLLSQT